MEEMNLAQLYEELTTKKYSDYPFQTKDLREQMALVEEVITGYWKPRFLVDYGARCAYEFMDKNDFGELRCERPKMKLFIMKLYRPQRSISSKSTLSRVGGRICTKID